MKRERGLKYTILPARFFDRPVLEVAPQLLGKYLVKKDIALMITEVEAYDGPFDLACHASKGRTVRTETLFCEAGTWYVYLIYGIYSMLNIVCDKKEYPAAVLIRGVEGYDGPGKLTRHLEIDRSFNTTLAAKSSGLWIEDRGLKISSEDIIRTPRIGVDYAGPIWANKPYRFLLKADLYN